MVVYVILQQVLIGSIQTLEPKYKVAIKWFHENKTIVNPDQFKTIALHMPKSNTNNVKTAIASKGIQAVSLIAY